MLNLNYFDYKIIVKIITERNRRNKRRLCSNHVRERKQALTRFN